jgi:hypothetical protein
VVPTEEALTAEAQALVGVNMQHDKDWINAVGEMFVFSHKDIFSSSCNLT